MEHQDEYHDNMVQLLELVWDEGYMAPGGPLNRGKRFHYTAAESILGSGMTRRGKLARGFAAFVPFAWSGATVAAQPFADVHVHFNRDQRKLIDAA